MLRPDGKYTGEMFVPLPETADETRAFEMMRAGFTPTEDTLADDLAMLMNPFDQYVIDDLNRQARGDYSLARQYSSSAGQMGSNRDMLAASDVEQNRLNAIGQFRQAQYNRALDQSLVNLPGLRQQDALNLMGIGDFQRNLDLQTKQAPLQALLTHQSILQGMPTSFGNFGTPETTVKSSGGGLGGFLGSVAPIVGSAIGGPIGGAIGGAVGGAVSGGGIGGALQGGLGGFMNAGSVSPFLGKSGFLSGLSQGNSLGQLFGSMRSPSPMGPYQPASFFR